MLYNNGAVPLVGPATERISRPLLQWRAHVGNVNKVFLGVTGREVDYSQYFSGEKKKLSGEASKSEEKSSHVCPFSL